MLYKSQPLSDTLSAALADIGPLDFLSKVKVSFFFFFFFFFPWKGVRAYFKNSYEKKFIFG